jgi:hypothetical protein
MNIPEQLKQAVVNSISEKIKPIIGNVNSAVSKIDKMLEARQKGLNQKKNDPKYILGILFGLKKEETEGSRRGIIGNDIFEKGKDQTARNTILHILFDNSEFTYKGLEFIIRYCNVEEIYSDVTPSITKPVYLKSLPEDTDYPILFNGIKNFVNDIYREQLTSTSV